MTKSDIFERLFIILTVFVVLTPKFNAIDSNAIRWALISINGFAYVLINFFNSKNNFYLNKTSLLILTISSFLLLFSIFNSINFNESIISSSKLIISAVALIILINCLKKIKEPITFIAKIFLLSILIESFYTFFSFFNNDIINFTGISMNRNISAFAIAIKLPFIIYLRLKSEKINSSVLLIIETISIVAIIFLQSRGALISIILMYLFLLFSSINKKNILIPLVFTIIGSYIFINNFSSLFNQKAINPIAMLSDQSFNQRISYYETAIKIFKEKPFFGHGIGSWKINSLEYLDLNESSIIVPYYVHNDTLQFLVEIGLVGTFLYLFFLFYIYKSFKENYNDDKLAIPILQVSFLIFLFDSNINFPIHRSQEMIPFIIVCSLSMFKQKDNFYNSTKIIMLILISVLIICSYITLRENRSLIVQDKFMSDYYSQSFEIDTKTLNNLDYKLPNLSANTVPISTFIAKYYIEENRYEDAEELLIYATKSNPHDILTKELRLTVYLKKLDYFNTYLVSKELFSNDNLNEVYAEIYFFAINKLNYYNEIFDSNILMNIVSINIHKLFYNSITDFNEIDKAKLSEQVSLSISKFPDDKFFTDFFLKLIK